MFNGNTYAEDVKDFKKIFTSEAEKAISLEKLVVIYIGRESCPYCRRFAKKLSGLAPEINTTIYYIDSSDTMDNSLTSFREKYSIRTVPGFLVSKDSDVKVICDSSTPEAVLIDMII